jgi:hypothetical protein
MSRTRRLAGIFAADVPGYSRRTNREYSKRCRAQWNQADRRYTHRSHPLVPS